MWILFLYRYFHINHKVLSITFNVHFFSPPIDFVCLTRVDLYVSLDFLGLYQVHKTSYAHIILRTLHYNHHEPMYWRALLELCYSRYSIRWLQLMQSRSIQRIHHWEQLQFQACDLNLYRYQRILHAVF